jgi:cytochrome c
MRSAMTAALALAAASLALTATAQAGDVVRGRAVFNRTCQNCHATAIGVNKVGPSLWGVLGRRAASVPDFNYSAALKQEDRFWDEAALDTYLTNPRGVLHGVRMYFKGLADARARADVIAYLATLK